MHWNAIEYARGEEVGALWYHVWYPGKIVGVHVQPGHPVRYYVRTSEGVSEYAAAQVRRAEDCSQAG